MDGVAAAAARSPFGQEVASYFYDAKPDAGVRFRSQACIKGYKRKTNFRRDIEWWENSSVGVRCLWCNMAFSKIIEIILLARVMGATHIVESGRMGGMQLTHYHHFGFALVSVEMFPVGLVQRSLPLEIPGIVLMNGDGSELLPQAIANIRRTSPRSRIVAIIDGPKGNAARSLALKLVNETTMVVIDDFPSHPSELSKQQQYRDAWPYATTSTLNQQWSKEFPISRDRAALAASGEFSFDVKAYMSDASDTGSMLLLGHDADASNSAPRPDAGVWQTFAPPAPATQSSVMAPCTTSVLEVASFPAGFGHLFASAMIARDLARKKGLRFVLEDSFWDGQPGLRADNYSSWAWGLTPIFQRASLVRSESAEWRRFGGSGRPRSADSPLRYDPMLELEVECIASRPSWYRVDTASNFACGKPGQRFWCLSRVPGGLDRSLRALRDDELPRLRADAPTPARSSAAPVQAVWHVRTGDWKTRPDQKVLLRMMQLVDDSFVRRKVQHRVLTFDYDAFNKTWPGLASRVLWQGNSGTMEEMAAMANADVLVSTGSAFSSTAAYFAPAGQIHLLYPTTAVWGYGHPPQWRPDVKKVQNNGGFRTLFSRRNTVPLDGYGRPFPSYRSKLELLARALDEGTRASAEIADLSFEPWLNGSTDLGPTAAASVPTTRRSTLQPTTAPAHVTDGSES